MLSAGTLCAVVTIIALACEMTRTATALGAVAYFMIAHAM